MLMLKSARKAKGLTQAEVASKIGISQNGYSQWENETRRIDKDSLLKLADIFDVSIDYLLGRTEKILNEEHAGCINLANIQSRSDKTLGKKEPPVGDERPNADVRAAQLRLADDLYDRLTPENRAKADSYLAYLLAEQAGPGDKR